MKEIEMSQADEVVVVATIIPRPEHRDAVRVALIHAIGRTHAEDQGCLLYALHESEGSLCMVEKWETASDLERHGAGAAIAELGEGLRERLLDPIDVQIFKAVPAGTEEQGHL
jgi:quinol monooxygenase YgiN